MSENSKDLLQVAGEIVGAYLAHNSVTVEEIPTIINKVFYALSSVQSQSCFGRGVGPLVPAVAIEESVHDDYLICLEDGKRLQMLKRHLSTMYNMTVDQYKERWGLDSNYPSVSPNYAKRRSAIARNTGLGMTGRRKKRKLGFIETINNSQQSAVVS
jgi:predicted transcriptional regulator